MTSGAVWQNYVTGSCKTGYFCEEDTKVISRGGNWFCQCGDLSCGVLSVHHAFLYGFRLGGIQEPPAFYATFQLACRGEGGSLAKALQLVNNINIKQNVNMSYFLHHSVIQSLSCIVVYVNVEDFCIISLF